MQRENRKVLTVREVCEELGLSKQTVIRLFENEPGVIILKRAETLHKKRYRSIRIPRVVFDRVVTRLTQ
jgi:hypothetical protein